MRGAKRYDMDENPVDLKNWTERGNVGTYYDFFMASKDVFGR